MSRRERLRENTSEEIKSLARQQMAENGTAALSLNGIAREMGMVPSALYRYYGSRDDLITALIIDAFNALADALVASVADHAPDDHGGRLGATSLAYRAWALAHPTDFLLIFGNPIPNYRAPLDQVITAAYRVFGAFLTPMQAAYDDGKLLLPAPPERLLPVMGVMGEAKTDSPIGPIAPQVAYVGQACWSKLHGMVMLELTHHLAVGDPDTFVRYELEALMQQIGLSAVSSRQ